MNQTDPTAPIRKSSLPTTPPPEWEFHTWFPHPDGGGDMVRGERQRGILVRRLVTWGDWEPVRPDRWADEPKPDQPAAASAVVAPPTNRADLRDRIAAAIRDAACPGDCGKTEEECARERIQPFAWHHGRLAVVEGEPEQFADAVLAVLPEQADRAAVARVRALHQQYTFGDGTTDYCAHCNQIRGGWVPWPCPTVRALDVELAVEAQSCRWEHPHPGYQCEPRTAVEAHDTGTQQRPARGDQFEAWLKNFRDACGGQTDEWHAFDAALDRYRLHADTGTPLGEHVCEGKVVGDCECLEPHLTPSGNVRVDHLLRGKPDAPAPVAQQPAAEVPTLAQMAVADHEYRELLMRRHQEMTPEQQAAAADDEGAHRG